MLGLDTFTCAPLDEFLNDTTNDLMRRNAELLKQNSVNTARANQRAVVDIETLDITGFGI